jgi:uncharacterized protein YfcZ (UPF0381/DUF406 family)
MRILDIAPFFKDQESAQAFLDDLTKKAKAAPDGLVEITSEGKTVCYFVTPNSPYYNPPEK